MEKFSRNQRVSAITKVLLENPNKVINLNTFTEMFNAAKSTISEDLLIVKETLLKLSSGRIETVTGAAGGVKYICNVGENESKNFVQRLCENLDDSERIIPGNFLYVTDLMNDPYIIKNAGAILASHFNNENVDYVVTVETKGIPLAYEVAKELGIQLVVVRRENRVTEGSTISINYVSGSSDRIQSMSLPKRSLKQGSSCIFIDDFMRAGGTTVGIINLLKEFNCTLTGIGVLIDNKATSKKLVTDYISLVDFLGVDDDGNVVLEPSKVFKK